jgi:spore maturation protein CgeB
MYEGYLRQFHDDGEDYLLSYDNLYKKLMSDSTEFVASYIRTLNLKGVKATAIIANDVVLQKKWLEEFGRKKNENILFQQIRFYSPEVVWIEDTRFTDVYFLSNIKSEFPFIKLLVAYHCAPVVPGNYIKFSYFDFIFTCTPGLQEDFESNGIRSYLVYHGFDKDLLSNFRSSVPSKNDIIFSGTLKQGKGYHLERIRLLDFLLRKGMKISLFVNIERELKLSIKKIIRIVYVIFKRLGVSSPENIFSLLGYGADPVISYPKSILKIANPPVYGKKMLMILAESKIVLNNHGDVAGNFAGNMRLFEATGAGSCLLTDNKSNLHNLFEPGKEIVTYYTNEDCLEKIKWLLKNETERKRIAEAGQRRTLKDHTVSLRCDQILSILNDELIRIREQRH